MLLMLAAMIIFFFPFDIAAFTPFSIIFAAAID